MHTQKNDSEFAEEISKQYYNKPEKHVPYRAFLFTKGQNLVKSSVLFQFKQIKSIWSKKQSAQKF